MLGIILHFLRFVIFFFSVSVTSSAVAVIFQSKLSFTATLFFVSLCFVYDTIQVFCVICLAIHV